MSYQPTILMTVSTFYPSINAGGPVRSSLGMIQHLLPYYRFKVITFDHDVGEKKPYQNIISNEWQERFDADVYYMSRSRYSLRELQRVISQISYDVIYNGSFYEPKFSIATRLLHYFGRIKRKNIVLSPRGEFATLVKRKWNLKSQWHKKLYIFATNFLKFHRGIFWHATSEMEREEMELFFQKYKIDRNPSIFTVSNMTPLLKSDVPRFIDKQPGSLRLVFLARIHPKKQIHYALKCLKNVQGNVVFDIFGPIDPPDWDYWNQCQEIINSLPNNIIVTYHGIVEPEHVISILQKYHAFIMPTLTENYGHSIVEALIAGCPVIISDQTPWQALQNKGIGWDIPLDQPERYESVIQDLVDMDTEHYTKISETAKRFGETETNPSKIIDDYRNMFDQAIRS
jgi:glycosyltransferase involved in cell wall biosynthesis